MSNLFRTLLSKINVVTKSHVINNTTNRIFNLNPALIHPRLYTTVPTPYEIIDSNQTKNEGKEIFKKVNELVANKQQGRLFAVIHVAGKQFKITEGDVMIVEGFWPPNVGDKINLDKVLLVGSKDFSLIGTPLVQHGLVNIHATVVEKNLSHTRTHFRKKRRKQYKRINFYRQHQTMLRINTISINGEVNKPLDVTGLDHAVF